MSPRLRAQRKRVCKTRSQSTAMACISSTSDLAQTNHRTGRGAELRGDGHAMSAKAPELSRSLLPKRAREPARWPQPPRSGLRALRPRTRRLKAIIDGGNHPRDAARDDIRQRKRPRFLLRHLLFRGASIRAVAGAAFPGRGRLFCSNRPGLKRAYPPACFSGKLAPLATRATGSVHRLVAGRG
jgi:hypothetical protein